MSEYQASMDNCVISDWVVRKAKESGYEFGILTFLDLDSYNKYKLFVPEDMVSYVSTFPLRVVGSLKFSFSEGRDSRLELVPVLFVPSGS